VYQSADSVVSGTIQRLSGFRSFVPVDAQADMRIEPFLLSLGLSKSLLALVWIAGPLSGTLVQPYVGIRSDNCRSRFGRRRPFMVGGAIATGVSLLALSWTKEIVGGVLSMFGAGPVSQATRVTTQVFAVLVVYILDFAINVGR